MPTRASLTTLFCLYWIGLFSNANPVTEGADSHLSADDPTICDAGIFVPDDMHICEGGRINLNGQLAGNYDYVWCENGNETNYGLNDVVDVFQDTRFTLKATYLSQENLVFNGDFGSGDAGFDTEYIPAIGNCFHGAGFLGCEGYFAVIDDPSAGHSNFDPCGGGPLSGGNMMVVNGAPAFQQIWCQDVCVDPAGEYLFQAYGASVNPGSPAELQFSIDGSFIGSQFNLSSTTCDWELFEETWEAGGQSVVEICINNQNTSAGGNDFALDDIGFFRICRDEKSFDVTVSNFGIDYELPEELTCENSETEININVTPLEPYDITWTSDQGGIIEETNDGYTVLVNNTGTYTVAVTDQNGCVKEELLYIYGDVDLPEFDLYSENALDCQNNSTTLLADNYFGNLDFTWFDEYGNEIGYGESLDIEDGGTYTLVGYNQNNGCENMEEITIEQDTMIPRFLLDKSGDISCNNPTTEIRLSSDYPNVRWQSPNDILSGIRDDEVTVTEQGTYIATVMLSNGCEHTDSIFVDEIEPAFSFQNESDTLITCNQPIAELRIIVDTTRFDFRWLSNDIDDQDSLTTEVNDSGTYYFLIEDSYGCEKLDSVIVDRDLRRPRSIDVMSETIQCDRTVATITAENPDNYDIEWSHENGTSGSGNTFQTADPGEITYTITADNGCTRSDSITIITEGNFPNIEIIGSTIDCNNPTVTLEYNSDQALLSAEWITGNNSIGPDRSITVTEGGLYSLSVIGEDGCAAMANYFVEVDTLAPEFVLPDDVTLDCNKPLLSEEITFDSPYDDIDYSGNWYDENNNQITISDSGSYTMTLSGANGCIRTKEFSVDVDTIAPSFDINDTETLDCNLTEVEISINTNESYAELSWSLPDNTNLTDQETIQANSPGTYICTMTLDNGCMSTRTIDLAQDISEPAFTADATLIDCVNASSTITVSSTDDIWSIDYLLNDTIVARGETWTTNEIDPITIRVEGRNGCISESTIQVEEDYTTFDFTAVVDTLDCLNSEDGVMINVLENVNYISSSITSISTGDVIGDINSPILESGRYLVTLDVSAICQSTYEIEVVEDFTTFDFIATADTLDCHNSDDGILIEVPDNIEYISSELLSLSRLEVIGDITQRIYEPGQYAVTLNISPVCQSTTTLEIVSDFSTIDFSVSDVELDCYNTPQPIYLNISESFESISVTSPDGTIDDVANAVVSETGTYTCSVTKSNGCVSEETFEVTQVDGISDVIFELEDITCDGAKNFFLIDVIGGNPSYTHYLDGVELMTNDYPILIEGSGDHSYQVIDSLGCSFEHIISIEDIEPVYVDPLPNINISVGETVRLELVTNLDSAEITSIYWYPQENLSCYNCVSTIFSGDEDASYEVSIIDQYGCESRTNVNITVEQVIRYYVPNVMYVNDDDNTFTIYSDDITNINFLNIYDRWGNLVFNRNNFEASIPEYGWDGTLNQVPVLQGVYVYYAEIELRDGSTEKLFGDVTLIR